ncbi:MAG: hypothetical protein EBQ89_03480 [Alphaproteobacteria bacterium]|nr:hypothetical protein [Alphaproteobacteria bacterium]
MSSRTITIIRLMVILILLMMKILASMMIMDMPMVLLQVAHQHHNLTLSMFKILPHLQLTM